ncbi:MAG: hypothetical protein ACO1NS_09450, partial [Daejeonella sp.]
SAQIRVRFGGDCAATEKITKTRRIRHEAGNNLLSLRCKPASVSGRKRAPSATGIGDKGYQSVTNQSPINHQSVNSGHFLVNPESSFTFGLANSYTGGRTAELTEFLIF